MADGATKGGQEGPKPFPAKWSTMTPKEKRDWQAKNRPPLPTGQPVTPAAAPQMGAINAPQHPTVQQSGQESGYEANNAYNGNGQEEENEQIPEQGATSEMAQGVDARKILARILRALADGFENGENS